MKPDDGRILSPKNQQTSTIPRHLKVFDEVTAALELNGLHCLTPQWMGTTHRYEFRCQQGHVFERTGSTYRHGGPKGCHACDAIDHMDHLHKLAAQEGVKCLDTDWRGTSEHYRFECSKGHAWSRVGASAQRNVRCPICMQRKRAVELMLPDGLLRLQQTAQSRGGQCLSTSYAGGYLTYEFRCKAQHQWQATGSDVLRGSWCLQCSHRQKSQAYLLPDGLKRLHELAQKKSGQCLASTYTGSAAKYEFVCAQGHRWEATGARIVRGAWCAQCFHAGKRLGIEVAREVAAQRGGQCLSEHYVSNTHHLEWMCDRGHVWKAGLANIRKNRWCPQCAIIATIRKPNSTALAKYIGSSRGK